MKPENSAVSPSKNFFDSQDLEEKSPWRDIAHGTTALAHLRRIVSLIQTDLAIQGRPLKWADIGCGLGNAAQVALKLGAEYTGLDSNSRHIARCRELHPYAHFIETDWQTHQGRYDLITFISSLHHFRDWQGALNNAFSCLSPKGVVMVDHEPTRFFAKLFKSYTLNFTEVDPTVLSEIEVHWFSRPSIRPDDLPPGRTEFHFDYVPLLGALGMRTRFEPVGRFMQSYRKIMKHPNATAGT